MFARRPLRWGGSLLLVCVGLLLGFLHLPWLGLLVLGGALVVAVQWPAPGPQVVPVEKAPQSAVTNTAAPSNLELAAVFANASVPLAYVDADLRLVRANGLFAQVAGMTPEAVSGRSLDELGFGPAAIHRCQEALREAKPIACGEFSLGPADGHPRWNWNIGPVVEEDARVTHLVLNLEEVTEEQLAKAAARRFEDAYRALQEHVSDGLLMTDLEGRIHEANVVAENLTGYERSRLRAMTVFELLPPDEHERALFALRNIEHGFRVRTELAMLHVSGERRVIELTAAGFPYGEMRMALGCLRDITDRKRAEELLRQREARCRAVFESGGMGVAVLGPDERVLEFNPAMLRISGYALPLLAGLPWRTMVPDTPSMADLDGDRSYTGRHRLAGGDGQQRWVDLTLTAVHDGGAQDFVVAMLMDASQAHEAEQAHERHEHELARANAWKARFIAAAGHDIRQPLQAATILVHLLDDHPLDPSSRAIVDRIGKAMDNLRDMVNSVMDISKLEAGLVVPEISALRLKGVLEVMEEEFRTMAEAKSIALHIDLGSDLWVRTDRRLLTRILGNLVSNAVRYTDQGEVRVSARQCHDEAVITVADTGIGIPTEERERIFEDFHQTSNGKEHRSEGIGLGLAIVEHLTRLLKLRIAVESQLAIGTVFTLWIPLAEESVIEGRARREERAPMPLGLHALVLDDETEIRNGLAMLLERRGFLVEQASGCEEALRLFADGSRGPHLIIADYRLAGGTGVDAIRRMREHLGRKIPAILLTAEPRDMLRVEARAQVCELLHKPATPRELWRSVEAAIACNGCEQMLRAAELMGTYDRPGTSETPNSNSGDGSTEP